MPSSLETTLSRGDEQFILAFFEHWTPASIILLGRLNYRLRNVVQYYRSVVWDVRKYLRGWFSDSDDALGLLANGRGLFCGPGVLQYFDRSRTDATRLDLCVGYGGLVSAGRFLAAEGYRFRPGTTLKIRDFDLVAVLEAAHFPEGRLNVDGDRSSTQEEHRSRTFRFVKTFRRLPLRVVVVHLVRCELHRFIFSMHSMFARSAFERRKSFVACQEWTRDSDDLIKMESDWLKLYSGPLGAIAVVGGVTNVDSDAEVGERRIGDERCWSIPCILSEDPMPVVQELSGPAFEVLDWTSGVTRHVLGCGAGVNFPGGCCILMGSESYTRLSVIRSAVVAFPPFDCVRIRADCVLPSRVRLSPNVYFGVRPYFFMPALPPEIRGLVEHDRFFHDIIVERPLVRDMVVRISDAIRLMAYVNRRYYCFACGAILPQPVWLPLRGGTFDHLDLFLANFFPNGCYSLRCIMSMFGIHWEGNIIISKHRHRSDYIAHVRREEDEFAVVLLGL
ncbi:hypothetical protein B0H16DRAFT_1472007 [Mycena metata]|uniref:Uncharacterized protein n=1 Tax=Mycena metata TaxID=1033252 RepID=A0AAD7MNK6_9AGAR|nr:hypothetical protein B0H16DRAFT_1472007 [Mycena metata]